jgi:Spy/CpxP family protein refolding chaperone
VVVIFLAGAASGALVTRIYAPRVVKKQQPSAPLPISSERRQEYLMKLDRELQLSPEQRQQCESILAASQKRMKDLWETIEPGARQEYQRSRKEISEVLTPEQRDKMKRWRHRDRDKENSKEREKTNGPAAESKPGACLPSSQECAEVACWRAPRRQAAL